MSSPSQPDLALIKSRQQKTWATGDFHKIAATLPITGESLCEAVDLRAGQRVLDVATGSGNTAIAAARRFCDVVGADYVVALVERARERAAAEGLDIEFREGDAEALPFEDRSFDVVLSTFGVMFAPDQPRAAAELVRVCRPGGTIGLASWTPDGFIGRLFEVTASYLPPPAGLRSPFRWGDEEALRELFGDAAKTMSATRRDYTFRYHSADHWIDFFRTYYGPTAKAFEALDEAGREAYAASIRSLIAAANRSGDATMVVPSAYLEVVITV